MSVIKSRYETWFFKMFLFLSQPNLDKGKGLRPHVVELQRRAADVKDDDPIIPFGSLPTVSRFGAISRTSKPGYPPNNPMPTSAKHTGKLLELTNPHLNSASLLRLVLA